MFIDIHINKSHSEYLVKNPVHSYFWPLFKFKIAKKCTCKFDFFTDMQKAGSTGSAEPNVFRHFHQIFHMFFLPNLKPQNWRSDNKLFFATLLFISNYSDKNSFVTLKKSLEFMLVDTTVHKLINN